MSVSQTITESGPDHACVVAGPRKGRSAGSVPFRRLHRPTIHLLHHTPVPPALSAARTHRNHPRQWVSPPTAPGAVRRPHQPRHRSPSHTGPHHLVRGAPAETLVARGASSNAWGPGGLVGSEDPDMDPVNSRATSAVCARLPIQGLTSSYFAFLLYRGCMLFVMFFGHGTAEGWAGT